MSSTPRWIKAAMARLDAGTDYPSFGYVFPDPKLRATARGLLLMTELDDLPSLGIEGLYVVQPDRAIKLEWTRGSKTGSLEVRRNALVCRMDHGQNQATVIVHRAARGTKGRGHLMVVRNLMAWLNDLKPWQVEYPDRTAAEIVESWEKSRPRWLDF